MQAWVCLGIAICTQIAEKAPKLCISWSGVQLSVVAASAKLHLRSILAHHGVALALVLAFSSNLPCSDDCTSADVEQHGWLSKQGIAAEGSLTRTESGNERLRQEADASRAEIWRKIQAAKLNNSKRHQVWAVLLCSL